MKLGFIGLGIMGESMSENLLKKSGQELFVYDLNANQVEKLVKLGATSLSNCSEVFKTCDVIFTMVPTSKHVLGIYEEVKNVLCNGKIWVDMSTIEPSVSLEVANNVAKTGAKMIDAPVVKSKAAAISGQLGIYVGGEVSVFEEVKVLLLCMGANVIHMGANSKGLSMKIAHNMLVAQIQNAVNEMFVFANKSGLDLVDATTAISYGGGQNFYLDSKSKSILESDFTTAFSIENMAKDVRIAKQIMGELSLNLPGFELVNQVYEEAMILGLGSEDFSATYKVKTKNNG